MKRFNSDAWNVGKMLGVFGISIVYEERVGLACMTIKMWHELSDTIFIPSFKISLLMEGA